jgi:two-component system, NarL family, sensor histidine kinase UhpB
MEARSATGYTMGVTERARASREQADGVVERFATRYRRTSLYVRVVAINAAIVAAATLVLALTPATVGYPIAPQEAAVLLVGVLFVALANALVLRISFGGLASVVTRMEHVDLLQPRERLPVVGGPETRAVVEGLNAMLARLEGERRESSRRTLAALEGERRRIARELHDEIGQRLTGTLLLLGDLAPDAPERLRPRVRAIQEDVRSTLDEVGVLAWQLRPGILDDLGLLRALEALVESVAEQAPFRVRAALPARVPPLAPETELAIYRIAQEALTNAVRHADARSVELGLAVGRDVLTLAVADEGDGPPRELREGAGIRGMRERAVSIGGRLAVERVRSGTGVRVLLELPLASGG